MLPTTSPTSTGTARYVVRSSDVISDNKVNVSEEGSDRVVWYKERFLEEEEIVEHVVDNSTSTLLWTIHRPLRGWYIRLRAPSFPPSTFISLLPLPRTSPYHTPAALYFASRTNIPSSPSLPSSPTSPPPPRSPPATSKSSMDSDETLSDPPQSGASHTYPPPPTPPSILVSPPTPGSVQAKLDELEPKKQKRLNRPGPTSQITSFLLAPHAQPPVPEQDEGLLARVLRAFKNNAPTAPVNSFTLCELPPLPPPPVPSPPRPPSIPPRPLSGAPAPPTRPHRLPPVPLLVFHDTTPVFTVNSSSGVFEINVRETRKLGVDIGFWIAVALAYAEFLGDRESYLAAIAD